jgi:acetoin:2,6-dichlorophenolindophenol oxidoreductase subunit beta
MRQLSLVAAVREALTEEMRRDDRVIVIGGDVRASVSGYAAGLFDEFGEQRVIDLPFAEATMAGAAAGAAVSGLRPVVDFGNIGFSLTAMDQLANEGPKAHYASGGQVSVPAVYLFDYASNGWGPQHDQAIYAVLGHLPGMKVVVPSNPRDARGLVKAAIRDESPVAVCIPHGLKAVEGVVPLVDEVVEIGRAEVVRDGCDASIVTCGAMVPLSLQVAEEMSGRDVSVEVVDLRSLVPVDWELIERSARKAGRVVVCDHGHFTCGIAPTIAAGVQERVFPALKAPVMSVATLDVPVPYNRGLAERIRPSSDRLLAALGAVLGQPAS